MNRLLVTPLIAAGALALALSASPATAQTAASAAKPATIKVTVYVRDAKRRWKPASPAAGVAAPGIGVFTSSGPAGPWALGGMTNDRGQVVMKVSEIAPKVATPLYIQAAWGERPLSATKRVSVKLGRTYSVKLYYRLPAGIK